MKGLSFIVTDHCNISCDFCAPECGPKLKGHLTGDQMIDIFDQIGKIIPVCNVVFTGGEPTLYRQDILKVLDHINAGETPVPSRIVTNAFWGRKREGAERMVSELKQAGLTEFNFSVDDFHQKFIPLPAIRTAIEVSLELEIPVLIAHKTYPGSKIERHTFEELLGREIPVFEDMTEEEKDSFDLAISTGLTIPVGRGAEDIDINEWVPDDTPHSNWAGPCREVLKNITVQSDGSFTPCCGLVERNMPVFYMGDLRHESALSVLERANNSTIYNWLALEGPEGLLKAIKAKKPDEPFLGRYLQNCQLCQEIFSCESKKKILADILPQKRERLFQERIKFETFRKA